MKRYLVILAVCLGIGTIGSGVLLARLAKIERTPTEVDTLFGDASAAEGLEISFCEYPAFRMSGGDSWRRLSQRRENTIVFDRNGILSTVKMGSNNGSAEREESAWYGYADKYFTMQISCGVWVNLYGEKSVPVQLEQQLKKSQKAEEITVSEYFEYYPFEIRVQVPVRPENNFTADPVLYEHWDTDFITTDSDNPWVQESAMKLRDIFRIPVIPEEKWEVKMENVSVGDHISWYGYASPLMNCDLYNPSFVNALTESKIYFSFSTYTEEGKVVDTSCISVPGGYGIYELPYSSSEGDAGAKIEVDKLKLFCPLNPKAEVLSLAMSDDQTMLAVVYRMEQQIFTKILDVATGKCLAEEVIGTSENRKEEMVSVSAYEDFFVVSRATYSDIREQEKPGERRGKNSDLAVIGRNEDGTVGTWLKTKAYLAASAYRNEVAMAFDHAQSRLAVVDGGMSKRIQVFSQEGQVYDGYFTSPLLSSCEGDSWWYGYPEDITFWSGREWMRTGTPEYFDWRWTCRWR
ncbi:MAG: hypothetical protein J5532_04375 [Lachnospiraceae bacterium]|nr:hypothetical protein [Lachnospiraceae bacterium]